mmetsp:Transcript_75344/g.164371  ORF Transcript_75344/g.164371 Transcript_75344/m.164371 type:complete len:409 (+) Transcript_75344:57-1283(+)
MSRAMASSQFLFLGSAVDSRNGVHHLPEDPLWPFPQLRSRGPTHWKLGLMASAVVTALLVVGSHYKGIIVGGSLPEDRQQQIADGHKMDLFDPRLLVHLIEEKHRKMGSSESNTESESAFKARLAALSDDTDTAAETRLEAGAAAIMGHWFDGKPKEPTLPSWRPTLRGSTVSPTPDSETHVHGADWYRVNINAVVRSGFDLDSPQVSVAPAGLFVHVAEVRGNRARVDQAAISLSSVRPVRGWMSIKTGDSGIIILRPSRQANLDWPAPDAPLSEQMRFEQQQKDLEKSAVQVAKLTATSKQLDDARHRMNAQKVAHTLGSIQRKPHEFEDQVVSKVGQAGAAAEKEGMNRANKVLESVEDILPGSKSGVQDLEGGLVHEVKIPRVSPTVVHRYVDMLGEQLHLAIK